MSQRNPPILAGIDGSVTEHSDVGATTSAILLNNWTAVVAPVVTDDADSGYAVGSEWTDVTADKSYKLIDATAGAAIWKETTAAGGTTNLGATANGTSLAVTSSTGTNAAIPAATTSAWGAMTDEDKTKLDSIGSYIKAEVLITSGSISASASDQAVPSLTYTIPTSKDGNYVIYAVLSVDIDNSDMKPLSIMLFKNGVKETNSVTMDFAKKNENQSVQLTYAMDGLVATDVIAVYVNNDNEDINTIIVGRMLLQSWAQ
jgi:hypothetical protein